MHPFTLFFKSKGRWAIRIWLRSRMCTLATSGQHLHSSAGIVRPDRYCSWWPASWHESLTLTSCKSRSCLLPSSAKQIWPRAGLEEEFLSDIAEQRKVILIMVFMFDLICYVVRLVGRRQLHDPPGFVTALGSLWPQVLNMVAVHSLVAWVNRRSARLGSTAVRQVNLIRSICDIAPRQHAVSLH